MCVCVCVCVCGGGGGLFTLYLDINMQIYTTSIDGDMEDEVWGRGMDKNHKPHTLTHSNILVVFYLRRGGVGGGVWKYYYGKN